MSLDLVLDLGTVAMVILAALLAITTGDLALAGICFAGALGLCGFARVLEM